MRTRSRRGWFSVYDRFGNRAIKSAGSCVPFSAIIPQVPDDLPSEVEQHTSGNSELRESKMTMRPIVNVAIALAVAAGTVAGQCVMDPIRIGRIEGRLLFGFQGKYRVLDKGEVQLLDPSDKRTVLASASVDHGGRFAIAKARPGKFSLAARSEGLIPAYVGLTMAGPRSMRSKQLILVILGADGARECGGASISVRSVADVDQVVSAAKKPEE